MSNEKMPERIRAGLIETYPQIKIQCWREETPGYPDPELKTVYLRSTPVLEHAREMQTRLEKILTILNVVSASGIRTKAEQEIHQIVFDILADIELATIKREEREVQE